MQDGLENNTFTPYQNVQNRNWVVKMLPQMCKEGNIYMFSEKCNLTEIAKYISENYISEHWTDKSQTGRSSWCVNMPTYNPNRVTKFSLWTLSFYIKEKIIWHTNKVIKRHPLQVHEQVKHKLTCKTIHERW